VITAPLGHLDFATVIRVSQAVSGEMVLGKLLDTLMRTAVEHTGAQRALLILSRDAKREVAAEATASNDRVTVRLGDEPVTGSLLPESVLRYVLRTRENVILDDAAAPNPFSADPYVAERHARSVFCLPLMHQAKFIGVLYLENNLAPRVFAPARTAVLKLLASQAAISIENSRLYRDLAEREARMRRLVDANIIGIFSWHADGRVFDANEEFVRIIGHSRDDLVSGRVRWTDFTLPEWRERDAREMELLRTGASSQAQERQLLRKDGTRVPVLAGGTMFEGSTAEGVAFVLDLTERKRAEQRVLAEHRATRILAEAVTVEEAIPRILETLCECLSWDLSAWWRVDREAGRAPVRRGLARAGGRSPGVRGRDSSEHSSVRERSLRAGLGESGTRVHSGCCQGPDLPARERRRTRRAARGLRLSDSARWRGAGRHRSRQPRDSRARPRAARHDGHPRQPDRSVHRAQDGQSRPCARVNARRRLIVNTIPGLVAILAPSGEVDVVNDQLVAYCGQPLEAMRQWGTNGTVNSEDLPHVAEDLRAGDRVRRALRVRGAHPAFRRRLPLVPDSRASRFATRVARSSAGTSCSPTSTTGSARR
jgi:PAS domain S-box-containing protein